MDLKESGQAIRRLRTEANIGLRELSRLANISPASLIAIEKGNSSPTLATLHKVLKALGTDFAEFFSHPAGKTLAPVFDAKEMRHVSDERREYVFLLPKRQDIRFEMVHETIVPDEIESEWEVDDCDIGGVILSGGPARLEIEAAGQWTLRKGDAFYIKAGDRHRLVNLGKRVLKQITVMDPPRY
ncbi:MAG: helix-turn-helix domain-containing protein [Candidatus Latescibacteria bacterium]|nr:helix-turn-helix domain-containing protein [Candidatus Latescibacterota bacterium]